MTLWNSIDLWMVRDENVHPLRTEGRRCIHPLRRSGHLVSFVCGLESQVILKDWRFLKSHKTFKRESVGIYLRHWYYFIIWSMWILPLLEYAQEQRDSPSMFSSYLAQKYVPEKLASNSLEVKIITDFVLGFCLGEMYIISRARC